MPISVAPWWRQVKFAPIDGGSRKDYLINRTSVVIWPAGLQPR